MAVRTEGINYVLRGPHGGVERRAYPTELGEDQFVMLKNLEVTKGLGAFVTGKGTTLIHPSVQRVPNFTGGFRFYYGSGSKILLAFDGGNHKKYNDATGAWTSIFNEGGGGGDPLGAFFAGFEDIAYTVWGANGGFAYNPTTDTWRRMGFTPPPSDLSPAVDGAGSLTGSYRYRYTCTFDSNVAHESNPTGHAGSVSPASQKVDVTLPSVAGVQGATGRKLYRTRAGGTEYYLLATFATTGNFVYSDNTPDSGLGAELVPNDNGLPPTNAERIVIWNGRMVLSVGKRLYFSAIVNTERSPNASASIHGAGLEIFPASHFLDVGDDNRPITQLAVMQGMLVVFKDDQIYNVTGDTARDIRAWRAQTSVGCFAPRSVVNVYGDLFFLGRTEGVATVYSYDGVAAMPVSLPIEPYFQETFFTHPGSGPYSQAILFRGRYLIGYFRSDTGRAEVAELDLRQQPARWLFHDKLEIRPYGWIHFNGPGDDGELYYVDNGALNSSFVGTLLRFENKQTDINGGGTPIAVVGYAETGWLHLGQPFLRKQLRHIEIYCKIGDMPSGGDPQPGDTLLTVARLYDFGTTEIKTECDAKNITTAQKLNNLCKVKITCAGGDQDNPERGYVVKLKITMQGPLEIYKVVIHADPEEPWKGHDS